jgi:glycosyltransferase involved in cell wall biosynthesis
MPDAKFMIVGPAADRDAVPQVELDRAAALGNVWFLGCDDVEQLYSAMDLVLASFREDFPLRWAAAMDCRSFSPISGAVAVVDDGINGVLVPVRDLARSDAIAALARDPLSSTANGPSLHREGEARSTSSGSSTSRSRSTIGSLPPATSRGPDEVLPAVFHG